MTFEPKETGAKHVGIGSIDEGTFSEGAWVPGRRLNGDENDQGRFWRFASKGITIEKAVVFRFE